MNVLTVCREVPQNLTIHKFPVAEFIFEQNLALEKYGVKYDYYLIKKGGVIGYVKEVYNFHSYLKSKHYNYDIIHAHGGHVGSLVNTQRIIPVVATYHGSDINYFLNRFVSFISLIFSKQNIFVSEKIFKKVKNYTSGTIIPCGVDLILFKPLDKAECRSELGFNESEKIVLFAGRRERKVKNFDLARKATDISSADRLIELKGFNRPQVAKLINACDCVLLTSKSEGSPMIIKEALACGCPIVSVDVGDIKELSDGVDGVFISGFDFKILAENIDKALKFSYSSFSHKLSYIDNTIIAQKILNIYKKIAYKQ
jgi:glycosyltransferase involved in cell wall biosynthesis